METKFQTSFIPKTTISTSPSASKPSVGLFLFIATLVFIATLIIAGGTYAYRSYLKGQVVKTKSDLDKNVKAFEPQTIEKYVRLESRIDTARILLSKHIAASNLFDYLSEATLKSVRFNDFKYELGPDGVVSLNMNGRAKNYNSVAYQSEVFGEKKELREPIFSNLDLDQGGNVIFNFSTRIEPGFIYYGSSLGKRLNSFDQADVSVEQDIQNNPEQILPAVEELNVSNIQNTSTSTAGAKKI